MVYRTGRLARRGGYRRGFHWRPFALYLALAESLV
jgi:hypothetical protein